MPEKAKPSGWLSSEDRDEFDFATVIEELAEVEWECSAGAHHDAVTINGNRVFVERKDCSTCAGTGRIVPFASLRVKCGQIHILACKEYMSFINASCAEVSCPGWVPESDERIACWEIMEHHPEIVLALYKSGRWLHEGYDVKEAVIRAALDEVKEQHGL